MGRKRKSSQSDYLRVVSGNGNGRRRGTPRRDGNDRNGGRRRSERIDAFDASRSKSGRRPRVEPDWDSADLVEDQPVEGAANPVNPTDFCNSDNGA